MKRILVVDDDESVLVLLETVLRHSGWDVTVAPDGQAALDTLGQKTFDALLCDKNLPLVPGPQVVLEARQRFPAMTTVLMTAAPEALALSQLGLDGYLAKPFRSNSLVVHTLESAMQRRKASLDSKQVEHALASARVPASRRN